MHKWGGSLDLPMIDERNASCVRDMIHKSYCHMNKIPAVFALLCVTALPMAAQTKVLVAKSRVPVSVVGEYHGGIAFPTACDEQGRAPFQVD